MRLVIGPAVVFVAAILVHDAFTSAVLAFIAVGWWMANEQSIDG